MADAIIVINAGSSSLKFSAYLDGDEDCELLFNGQIESLLGAPQFVACNAAKELISEHRWEEGTRLGHDGAVRYLFEWGQSGRLGGHCVKAVGHRVVHGGLKYTQPVLVNEQVLDQLEEFTPLAPLHQPHNLSVIRPLPPKRRGWLRSPVSTRHFTAATALWKKRSRCRGG